MTDPQILAYITGELALLLLVTCVLLLTYLGKLRRLIGRLEEKILALRQSLAASRKQAQEALSKLARREKIKPKKFLDYLDEEIEATRDYHQSLNPDRDIVLDITPDAPKDRQASSLRHAFLIAEKEARYAGGEGHSDWEVLQGKLQQIIQFYESLAPPPPEPSLETGDLEAEPDDQNEGIANYKKRIENLEGFKRLFFDMERKWEEAKKQADEYYRQLTTMGQDLGVGEDFEAVLEQYSKSFNEIEDMIIAGAGGEVDLQRDTAEHSLPPDDQRSSVGPTIIVNQDEIQRLRNMAVDQHKVITELKRQLYAAKSAEDKQAVIDELTQQLEQHERFLKEAETCIQLIEDELSRTLTENEALKQQIAETTEAAAPEEISRLQKIIKEFTAESKKMLATIASLEKENQSLIDQLEQVGDGGADTSLLRQKLNDVQQELLNLQTQHIELEERYLELKTK